MDALTRPIDVPGERQIRGGGTPESSWQAWPGLAALPDIGIDQLVPEGRRAVIVAPHPDDEILGTGGLIAELTRHQREALLIAVTDGTGSHPGSRIWPPERLARERPLETQSALAVLGAAGLPVRRLGLADGRLAGQEPELVCALARHLLPHDIVFTTWRLDGHPDHEACGRACATVAARTPATLVELPIWAWHWALPGDARLPWSRACRLPLPDRVADLKRQAVQAFKSQIEPDLTSREGCVLPPSALDRLLRPMEVFFR